MSFFIVLIEAAFAAALVAAVFSLPIACWSLERRGPFVKLLALSLIFPAALSPTLFALVLTKIFGGDCPFGLKIQAAAQFLSFWPANVILGTIVALPLTYLATKRALERIDASLIDSMRVLGFSGFALFWKILLPMAWPGILAGVVLGFVRALGEFGGSLLLLSISQGHPDAQTDRITAALALSSLFIALALLAGEFRPRARRDFLLERL